MLLEEGFDRGGAMVRGAVLDQEERLGRLFEDGGQESDVAGAVEAAVDALVEQPPTEQLDQAEHLVRLALARGLDDRLLADPCPGVADRTPLSELGLVPKPAQPTGPLALRPPGGKGVRDRRAS